jgi:hypothetical protein
VVVEALEEVVAVAHLLQLSLGDVVEERLVVFAPPVL